jgi:hypothetical protein
LFLKGLPVLISYRWDPVANCCTAGGVQLNGLTDCTVARRPQSNGRQFTSFVRFVPHFNDK